MIGLPYVTVTWVPRIFGKCASRISLDPEIESGMIGQPVFVAILNEPLWNSPSSSSLSVLPRVPSGKIQMEVPLLISSHPERIICRPCLMSERSRNRQWMSSIQFFNSGMRESSFLATNPQEPGTVV